MNESTCRRLRSEYLAKLKIQKQKGSDGVIKALSTKQQGRPLLLGQELDNSILDHIEALRVLDGVVNTHIVMAATVGIIKAKDITLL